MYTTSKSRYGDIRKTTALQKKNMTATALQKNNMIERLKDQNDRLKEELKVLTEKLEEFVQKAKAKKQQKLDMKRKGAEDENEIIKQKKAELAKIQNKIKFY